MLNNLSFYHSHIKSAVVAFGRIFSNIQIVRVNPNDQTKNQTIDIPLSYAPKEKALVRITQDPELTNHVHTTLPLMSFEILGMTYDPSRKLNRMNPIENKAAIAKSIILCSTTAASAVITSSALFGPVVIGSKISGPGILVNARVVSKASTSSITISAPATATATNPVSLTFQIDAIKRVFTPVPYNVEISLYVLTKSQEDNLQIVEQILPVFTPEYTVSINSMPDLNLVDDVAIVLNSITMQDEYDGDFQTRRFVTTTLSFTLKLNLYGGIGSSNIILKAIENFTAVKEITDIDGETETLTSTGTKPGDPILDVWTRDF